jgi:hypothetical protein
MSRTHKHVAARVYHKQLREAIFGYTWAGGSGKQDLNANWAVQREAAPEAGATRRYGMPLRAFYQDRRGATLREKRQLRIRISEELIG